MRITTSVMNNFKLSDANVGIKFIRNMLDGYQLLNNSIIVAESPNVGRPSKVKVFTFSLIIEIVKTVVFKISYIGHGRWKVEMENGLKIIPLQEVCEG